jgi:Tol biopolymer transport system component
MARPKAAEQSSPRREMPAAPGRPRRTRHLTLAAALTSAAALVVSCGAAAGPHSSSLSAPQSASAAESASGAGSLSVAVTGLSATLKDPGGPQIITSVAFSPDDKLLVACDVGGSAEIWNASSTQQVTTLTGRGASGSEGQCSTPGQSGAPTAAFSPDGAILATANSNDGVCLWSVATWQMVATLTDPAISNPSYNGPSPGVNGLAFSPDGATLAVADNDGNSYLWNVAARRLTATLTDPDSGGVKQVAFSPDGKTLAAGDANGSAYLWKVVTGRHVATLTDPTAHNGFGPQVNSVAFSPSGATLATGDQNGNAYLWDVATLRLTATLTDPATGASNVDWVSFSPDGQTLATIDYYLYTWNVATQRLTGSLRSPGGLAVGTAAFSPDGKILATGQADVSLWHVG